METMVGSVRVRFDDIKVLKLIGDLRRDHHACTGRSIAGRYGCSPASMSSMLARLQALGLVHWTAMPGSVHVTEAGQVKLDEVERATAPDARADGQAGAVAAPPATSGKPAKKAAANKAAPKRR